MRPVGGAGLGQVRRALRIDRVGPRGTLTLGGVHGGVGRRVDHHQPRADRARRRRDRAEHRHGIGDVELGRARRVDPGDPGAGGRGHQIPAEPALGTGDQQRQHSHVTFNGSHQSRCSAYQRTVSASPSAKSTSGA